MGGPTYSPGNGYTTGTESPYGPLKATLDDRRALYGDSATGVPDLTDEALQRARMAARMRLLTGASLGSTFLTGPIAAGNASASASLPGLLGSP